MSPTVYRRRKAVRRRRPRSRYDVMAMKNLLLALALALPLAAAHHEEGELVAAEKAWAKAVAAHDYATLEKVLDPDLIYAHSTGVIETKEEYLGKLKQGTQRYDGIEHEKTTVRAHGNAAVAHSIVRMHGATKGTPFDNRLMMIHTWIKKDGAWRLVAHQTTRLTQ